MQGDTLINGDSGPREAIGEDRTFGFLITYASGVTLARRGFRTREAAESSRAIYAVPGAILGPIMLDPTN